MKATRGACLALLGFGSAALIAETLPPVTPPKRIAADDIERLSQELATAKAGQSPDPWLVISPAAQLAVRYRNASGRAEMHRTMSEIIFIKGGNAHLQLGGELVAPTGADNEPRSESIRGGELLPASAGDIFNIPAGTPHRFVLAAGETITYLNIKIDSGQALEGSPR